MENEKKIELIADILEIDEEECKPETVLSDLDEWNSMSKLSLIVMFDDECGKTLTSDQIKSFGTVQDIMDAMD